MNKYRTPIITTLLVSVALIVCLIAMSPFTDDEYDQRNFIKYYLLTPKPLMEAPRVASSWYFTNQTVEGSGLQISTLNFTGIQRSEMQSLSEKLQTYIDHYPNRHETMSIAVEERNGMFELRIIHYDLDDEK